MPTTKTHLKEIGQEYRDFIVTRSIEIAELQCHLVELTHKPSGAHVMHIANEDPENLFCLSLRTHPYSSNGVAHILEHTVLCGSEKFPVKDPFFAMTRRSLNTFMNALTGSDFTCYPAASQEKKDFYNLLEVYLDAVFKPKLKELSFLQEGWRLEFENPEDPKTPLQYKGIVYNEMKGHLASPTTRLTEAINETLFPNLTYGYNSGGEPKTIPQLTYDELLNFHKKYYHPSQCLFFFYGSFPLKEHLDFILEHTLYNIEKPNTEISSIPLQPRFKQPVVRQIEYPIAPEESEADKTFIAIAWLTTHILEQQDLLALLVLDIILMETDASPLKLALLSSGLCKQANSFIEDEISEIPLSIILRGCSPENREKIEDLILKTLQNIVKNGIPLQQIENAIHQLEFYRSEITGDSTPFGLSLFMRSALLKQHGGEPESGLVIHSLFNKLYQQVLDDPQYLTRFITKYLIENTHRITVVMSPSKTLGQRETEEEKALLEKIKASMTPVQVDEVLKKSKQLEKFQKIQEEADADILPKVILDDVSRKARNFELEKEKLGNLNLFHHSCFTNNIVYADLIFDLPDIQEEDLFYVRLFTMMFSQVGSGNRDYKENLEYLLGNTGGVSASLAFNMQAADHTQFNPSLHIRGKALHRKANKLFPLMNDMASSLNFTDKPRIKEILLKHYTALESSINQNALRYAINLSASGLSKAARIAHAWYGIEYFQKVKELAQNFDALSDHFIDKMLHLKDALLCLEGADLLVTCNAGFFNELKGHGFYGLEHLEAKSFQKMRPEKYKIVPSVSQGRIISSQVAFTGKVFPTVSYVHQDAPALNIAAYLFDNLTLHTEIREKGGAYGGGATSNPMSGNFYFYSYSDPNISKTLNAFEKAIETIIKGDFDDEDLEEAKLEMIQSLDSPVSPGSRGEVAYSRMREGRTFEMRQAFRDKILALNAEDVIGAVNRHIVPSFQTGATVVFAGKDLLEKENAVLKEKHNELIIRGL